MERTSLERSPFTLRSLLLVAALLGSSATAAPFTLANAYQQYHPDFPQMAAPAAPDTNGLQVSSNVEYSPGLYLDVYAPKEGSKRVAVLLVHGGGWESGSRDMEAGLAVLLARRGFVALTVGYRLGHAGRFPEAIHDLKTAVSWTRRHAGDFGIHPDKIAVCGASAGGQLAAFIGATNGKPDYNAPSGIPGSTRVQAVIDIDGLADFTDKALVEQQRRNPSAPDRFLGCPYDADPARWQEASPLFHVNAESAPVLFLNSTCTSPLLPGRAQMAAALKRHKIATRTVTFPGTPHVFWLFDPWRPKVADEIAAFLKEQLP